MDELYRVLPIITVILFAILISIFQSGTRTYQSVLPSEYVYQTNQIDDTVINETQDRPVSPHLNVDPWWSLMVLLVPAIYFLRAKFDQFRSPGESAGRGYQIVYQDIRSSKKRGFKTSRKPRSEGNKNL